MGRFKKYFTDEEKCEAQKRYSKKYYWKNKEKMDTYMRKRYHERKQEKENQL